MSSPSDPPGHLLALASGLADPAGRRETARALARAVGAEDLLVFVSDPQLAVPLPAPGFPQTLPQGRRWHEFLARCGEAAWRRGELPFPDAATVRPVAGVAGAGGAILVLLGGAPRAADAEPLRLLLPLLAATFAGEQAARAAAGHAAVAEQTAARANALARALDDARAALQGALRDAQDAQHHLTLLVEASALLASSLDYEATLRRLADLAVPALADWCFVYVRREGAPLVPLALAHRDPARVAWADALRRRYPLDPDAAWGVPRVLRTGRAEFHPAVSEAMLATIARDAEERTALRDLAGHATIVVPLAARGQTLGALSLVAAAPDRCYTAADLALAEELAHRAGLAVDNARLYHEAREAIQVRDRFLSIAAHELRTPVTTIKGYAQLLLRQGAAGRPPGAERQRRYLRVIDQASDRLDRLTDDLLNVSRMRLGQFLLRPAPVDLAALVRNVAGRERDRLGASHHLALDEPAGPCPMLADADRIDQVLTNLLENAAKYSPAGGEIRVTLDCDAAGATLAVRDEGIGLAPGMREAIFEPFGRAANATRQQIPGLGLGLAISRDIVEHHGGRIWAESPGEGRGTTMRVWLPTNDEVRMTNDE